MQEETADVKARVYGNDLVMSHILGWVDRKADLKRIMVTDKRNLARVVPLLYRDVPYDILDRLGQAGCVLRRHVQYVQAMRSVHLAPANYYMPLEIDFALLREQYPNITHISFPLGDRETESVIALAQGIGAVDPPNDSSIDTEEAPIGSIFLRFYEEPWFGYGDRVALLGAGANKRCPPRALSFGRPFRFRERLSSVWWSWNFGAEWDGEFGDEELITPSLIDYVMLVPGLQELHIYAGLEEYQIKHALWHAENLRHLTVFCPEKEDESDDGEDDFEQVELGGSSTAGDQHVLGHTYWSRNRTFEMVPYDRRLQRVIDEASSVMEKLESITILGNRDGLPLSTFGSDTWPEIRSITFEWNMAEVINDVGEDVFRAMRAQPEHTRGHAHSLPPKLERMDLLISPSLFDINPMQVGLVLSVLVPEHISIAFHPQFHRPQITFFDWTKHIRQARHYGYWMFRGNEKLGYRLVGKSAAEL